MYDNMSNNHLVHVSSVLYCACPDHTMAVEVVKGTFRG